MIRSSFAEQLELEDRPVRIVITKLGGVDEDLDTKLYKVSIFGDNDKMMQTIQAIGIPEISEDTTSLYLRKMETVLGIPSAKFRRKAGPIDLLIGINYPLFHLGETKAKVGLVARRSPLEWVVFGSNSEDSLLEGKQVFHVRLADPIDLIEFWKTESMGVAVSPCTCEVAKMSPEEAVKLKLIEESSKLQGSKWIIKYPWKRDPNCLPDNYSQVVKKLESTERRLKKNPERAKMYNKQIKEMEEMNFCQKAVNDRNGRVEWPSVLRLASCSYSTGEENHPYLNRL